MTTSSIEKVFLKRINLFNATGFTTHKPDIHWSQPHHLPRTRIGILQLQLQPRAHFPEYLDVTDFSQVPEVDDDARFPLDEDLHVPRLALFQPSGPVIVLARGVVGEVVLEIGHLGDAEVVKAEDQFDDVAVPERPLGRVRMIGAIAEPAYPVNLPIDVPGREAVLFDQFQFLV